MEFVLCWYSFFRYLELWLCCY